MQLSETRVAEGSILGRLVLGIFLTDIASGTECTLSESADATKLSVCLESGGSFGQYRVQLLRDLEG